MSGKQARINPKNWEIWQVELSISSTDAVGHEPKYQRPCIVAVANSFNDMVTVIPLTSKTSAEAMPYVQKIVKDPGNGLDFDSFAILFNMRSLSFERFKNRVGRLSKKSIKLLKLRISSYFNL
ncbi:MAG: type II toxin-antitoxin system PemK/MazF family toxin [Candidatus Hodarchaeota archaeon]